MVAHKTWHPHPNLRGYTFLRVDPTPSKGAYYYVVSIEGARAILLKHPKSPKQLCEFRWADARNTAKHLAAIHGVLYFRAPEPEARRKTFRAFYMI